MDNRERTAETCSSSAEKRSPVAAYCRGGRRYPGRMDASGEGSGDLVPWLVNSWMLNVAKLSNEQLAAKAYVVPEAVGNWRTGRRKPDLRALDEAFMADGTFMAIARAARTPLGLKARRRWEKTFTDNRGPVWVWLRPTDGDAVHAELEYGPFRRRCDHACDSRGVFINLPVAGGNPPLIVRFDSTGWADFGPGEPPVDLGIPIFSPFLSTSVAARIRLLPSVMAKIRASFSETEPDLVALAREFELDDYYAHAFLETVTTQHPPHDIRSGESMDERVSFDLPTGADFKRLRQARQLSVKQVVESLNELLPMNDFYRVSEDQLDRFERGGRPTVPLMRSRLDMQLDGGGLMCCDPVAVRRRKVLNWIPAFPNYWIGPIWLVFRSSSYTEAECEVLLHWFPWRKALRVRSGQAVTTRRVKRGGEPLIVRLPPGWSVESGLGGYDGAIDVQEDWSVAGARGMLDISRTIVVEVGHALAQVGRRRTRGTHLLGG
jgi:hypothetical protein